MSGQITRKDIITDEALNWGRDYAKVMDEAIGKNKEFVDTIVALNAENVKLRRSENQTEFLKQKNEIKLITEKNNAALKEQMNLEIALEKIKQESVRTAKLELDVESKKEAAKKRNNKLTIEERVQNEVNNRLLKQAALAQLNLTEAYTKLNNARTAAKNKLRELIITEGENAKVTRQAAKEFEVLDRKIRQADRAVGDFSRNVGNYPLQNFASGLRNLIGAFGLTTGIALFAGVMKGAYDTIKQFEQGVADLSAITGASGKDLEYLKKQAIDTGKGVQGGAIAVVEAYKLIASAKPELLENVQALNSVTKAAIQLSQAAGMELPEAATALTDTLNQFNAPAEQAGEFVDALANAAKYGAAEIPATTEALLKFGAVARTSNISVQESVALIQLLAENGIKGAEAGTKLRNVLLKISAPDALPKEARKEFERLGISLSFLKDNTIPIQEKLEKLKPLLKDNSSIVKIFGDENATAAINVLSHTDRLGELIPKMGEFGTAAEQAEIRMNTLNGKTEILSSTYDAFILSVGNGNGVVSEFFKKFVVGTTLALEGLIRLNTSWNDLFGKSAEKGIQDGKAMYKELFQDLYKPLTNAERKSIQDKIKAIQDEINNPNTSNQKSAQLRGELEGLSSKLIKDNKKESAKIIRDIALNDLEIAQKEYAEVNKKLDEYKDNAFKASRTYGLSEDDMNKRKEEIIRRINQEKEIIRRAEKEGNIKKVDPGTTTETTDSITGLSDAENKKRLAEARKAIEEYIKLLQKRNKDEFELNQFRLEREIYYNQLILDNEEENIQNRTNAFLQIEQLKKASLDESLAYQLKSNALAQESNKQLSKAQIDALEKQVQIEARTLINSGKLKENATSEEILIYEKYILELKRLDDKRKADVQKLVDSQTSIIQKQIDAENQVRDTALNNRIIKENELYQNALQVAGSNFQLIEDATKAHEARLLKITQDSNKQKLQYQIDTMQSLLDENKKLPIAEQISAEKRAEIENKLSQYRKELSDINIENVLKSNEAEVQSAKEREEKIVEILKENADRTRELSQSLATSLIDLANSIFDARIASIDAELQANADYYDNQIELAGNDARQKDLLEKEKAKKAKELEKERKKEMIKAAIFNKVISLAEVGVTLAKTLMQINLAARALDAVSLGTLGLPYQGLQTGLAIGVAAAQTATILATPLPKYKDGRKGGPAQLAYVGDGGRVEVLSDPDGSNPIYTPKVPTLTYLKKDQMVHKTVDDYENYVRTSTLQLYDKNANQAKQYQFIQNTTSHYDKEIIEELKRNTKAVEKNKGKTIIQNKIDFGHEVWRINNIKWS